MLSDKFSILSGIITVASAAQYAYYTFKGRNQPNRITWILWSIAPMIGFFAQLSQHVGLQSILTFSIGFGPLLVLAASFINRKSYWQLTAFDYLCGSISLLALVLWVLTGQGMVALILSIIADLSAAVPTIKKSYLEPESESGVPFLLGALAALITLLTIKTWTVSESAFGVYVFLSDSLIAALVLLPTVRLRKLVPKRSASSD